MGGLYLQPFPKLMLCLNPIGDCINVLTPKVPAIIPQVLIDEIFNLLIIVCHTNLQSTRAFQIDG